MLLSKAYVATLEKVNKKSKAYIHGSKIQSNIRNLVKICLREKIKCESCSKVNE